jgi:tetratricopeptide (TPR) repeat protein
MLKKIHSLFRILLPMLVMTLITCNREKSLSQEAFEKEIQGYNTEAILLYNQALSINPNYSFANSRLGYLLSESQLSIIPAIYHLEKAKIELHDDIKISLKLVDLRLFLSDFDKVRRIQKEISPNISLEASELILTITDCLSATQLNEKKKLIEKIDAMEFPTETSLFYRSLALCYETSGESVKAEEIVENYRKAANLIQ